MLQEKATLNIALSTYDRSVDTVDAMLNLVKTLLERNDLDKREKRILKNAKKISGNRAGRNFTVLG